MKDLLWDDTLSVQIDEIDEDHQRLVEVFNLLNQSISNQDDSNYIAALIDELIKLTVYHFSHEERLMTKYDYQGLEEHKKEHNELIESALQLQKKFESQNNTVNEEDIEFLEHWLTGHILGADMEMSDYLCQVM